MQKPESKMPTTRVIPLDSIKSVQAEWLWYPYIPLGKVTIMQGDPGEGKSAIALRLAAAVSRGTDITDPRRAVSCANYVICLNAEDGLADTVKPRLERAGADCSMIFSMEDAEFPITVKDGRLDQLMQDLKPRLVILDPIQAYLGDHVDMHRANEVRPVRSYLAGLAERHHCAILLIGHMNKMQGGKSLYRGLGSIDLTAAARSILLVTRDPANPANRVIVQIKNSLAPEGEPVAFRFGEDAELTYLGAYEFKVEEALNAERQRPTQRDRAEALLLEWLDKANPLYIRDMYPIADSEGISKQALQRAKQNLRLVSEKTEKGWIWKRADVNPPPFDTLPRVPNNPRFKDAGTRLREAYEEVTG